jgi:outer membrane protein TolC
MVGPDYSQPNVSVQEKWIQHRDDAKSGGPSPDSAWWESFRDPVLNRLVDMACRNNLSLQAAGARIFQARAQLNQSRGNLFPQDQALSGGIEYLRIKSDSRSGGDVLPNGLIPSFDPNLSSLFPSVDPDFFLDNVLFAASWEIDFWGKYRRGIQSAAAGYLSSVAAYQDSLVTLQADVASAYVNIRTFEERIAVNQRNVKSQEGNLLIAEARFEGGETSELDVDQAKTNLRKQKRRCHPSKTVCVRRKMVWPSCSVSHLTEWTASSRARAAFRPRHPRSRPAFPTIS